MDCEQFGKMLDNYENLTKEEHLKLAEHTAECAECRAELEFMTAILKVTKSLPEITPNEDFLENLNKRIDKEKVGKFRFAAIDWKRYGSVAACLLFAVVAGFNGKTLVSRMHDNDNGVIEEKVVSTTVGEKADYNSEIAEIIDSVTPMPVQLPTSSPSAKPEASVSPSPQATVAATPNTTEKANTARVDAKDMVIDRSVYTQRTPQATAKPKATPTPTAAPVKDNNEDTAVSTPQATEVPVTDTEPYTIEKDKYRIPNENNSDAVIVSETDSSVNSGYSLSGSGENTTASSRTKGRNIVDKEIESAVPASTIVVHAADEEKARKLIEDYIVGTYGTYYMTTESYLEHLFIAFDYAGIEYEKYLGGSSDKISFRLVVLP